MTYTTGLETSKLIQEKGIEIESIEGYDGYFILSDGRIWSEKTHRFLRPATTDKGYYSQGLSNNGKQRTFLIHRLVANAFIPNPNERRCINHIDGDKKNNGTHNLEWCSHSENTYHAFKIGLMTQRGSKNNFSKLDEETVSKIKRDIKDRMDSRKIMDKFGIDKTMLYRIKHGISWKHV